MGFRPIQDTGGDKLRRVEIIYAGAATSNADALSGLETVIVTGIVAGIFTLAAVVLGFLGSSRSEARVRRREDQAQYDRLVTEAVSASEAMSSAISEYRSKWAFTLTAIILQLISIMAAHSPEIADDTLTHRQFVASSFASMFGRNRTSSITDFWIAPDIRYMQVVLPVMQRLNTALTPLRIGKDPAIAEAAQRLMKASEEWAQGSREFRNRRSNRAHEEWHHAFAEFKSAVLAKPDHDDGWNGLSLAGRRALASLKRLALVRDHKRSPA